MSNGGNRDLSPIRRHGVESMGNGSVGAMGVIGSSASPIPGAHSVRGTSSVLGASIRNPGASPVPGASIVPGEHLGATSKVSLGGVSKMESKALEDMSASLLDSDTISLDKFKLDQVSVWSSIELIYHTFILTAV